MAVRASPLLILLNKPILKAALKKYASKMPCDWRSLNGPTFLYPRFFDLEVLFSEIRF